MKNYSIYILLFFASILILLPVNNHLYAKEQIKTIRQQLIEIINNRGGEYGIKIGGENYFFSKPEEVFEKFITRSIEINQIKTFSIHSVDGKDIDVVIKDTSLSDDDYKAFFGENNDKKEFKCAIANSICHFYGISRKELLHLRQQKVVVNRAKKEINKLFDESLWIINNWVNKTNSNGNEQKIDEARLAKLIADELIKKQNEPLAPDAQIPTVPTLL